MVSRRGARAAMAGPAVAGVALWTALQAHAQVPVQIPPGGDPGVLQQREVERELRLRQEEQQRRQIDRPIQPAVPPAGPAADPTSGPAVNVREIRFEPTSALLEPAALEPLLAQVRGRTVPLGRLRALVEEVNALYRSRGIVTAQAVLPPQDVTDGIVRIQLIEGRVGRIALSGNASTRSDYVTDRLSAQPGALVDVPALEQDMLRFNRTNDAQLRADLRPGAALGQTDVAITVTEPKRDDLRVFADNSGAAVTGEVRSGVSYTRRSLTGRRDDLFLSGVVSQGHRGRYLTYSMPVGERGTRMTAGLFRDDTVLVNGQIAALNVTGEATSVSLSLRHPLHTSVGLQVDGIIGLRDRRTRNWIDGTPLSAADQRGGSLGVEVQKVDDRGWWTASGELAGGVNRPDGDSPRDYTVLRGSVRRSQALSATTTLLASYSWQYAGLRLLPASEQFLLGGEATVRGYAPGLYSGDRGWVLNLELQHKLATAASSPWTATALVFLDHGDVRVRRPAGSYQGYDTLTSMGVGMLVSWQRRFSARAMVAMPVSPPPQEPRQIGRVLLQLNWTLL